ncbi:hypothetical protein GCM10009765_54140 [Fodinicola feengrottensis]|uniref:PPM-type phosphatase domain-containing protein n=1 Tax=Fodinicola feengrottensis TaxID=435914 RepID=A0ABP4U2D0_9ACTN
MVDNEWVDVLGCGHGALRGESRLCCHLLVDEPPGCYRLLTGFGAAYDLVCQACAESEAAALLDACEGCTHKADAWDGVLGWRGQAEIRHRDEAAAGTWTQTPCGMTPVNERCLAPMLGGWLVLTADGLFDTASGRGWGDRKSRSNQPACGLAVCGGRRYTRRPTVVLLRSSRTMDSTA